MKRTKQKTSFSGYFPADLLLEVLAGLPVKSLLRFRCVSKTWYNIIDSPDFIFKHLNHNNNNNNKNHDNKCCHVSAFHWDNKEPRFYFATHRSDTFRRNTQLIKFPNHYRPYSSIDGLILFLTSPHVVVWNPSTRKSVQLPHCPLPFNNRTACAIGFSPLSNDYKVVVSDSYRTLNSSSAFAVYALNDGCWRTSTKGIDVVLDSKLLLLQHNSVSTKGAAHWLTIRGGPYYYSYSHVISFDFDVEEFSVMELPNGGEKMLTSIFLLGESLAVLGISPESTCIWLMDKDEGIRLWTKWYSGDSSINLCNFLSKIRYIGKVLFVECNGVFLMMVGRVLISYNFRSHEFRRLAKSIRHLEYMDTHVESLYCKKDWKAWKPNP